MAATCMVRALYAFSIRNYMHTLSLTKNEDDGGMETMAKLPRKELKTTNNKNLKTKIIKFQNFY